MSNENTTPDISVPDHVGPLARVIIDPQKAVPTLPVRSAEPSSTQPQQAPHKANGWSFWKTCFFSIGYIAEKGKNIFSFTALLAVIIWAFIEYQGYELLPVVDQILAGAVVLLMVFEIWKTTSSDQISKKAFTVDLFTGVFEILIFTNVITVLVMQNRFKYYQLVNWSMLIFTCCDVFLVIRNRFVMVFRQITSVSSDDHQKQQHQHAAVAGTHHSESHSSD